MQPFSFAQRIFFQKRHYRRAFTLVEILLVLALMAFLTTLAAPSLRDLYTRYQIQNVANDVLSAIRQARSEAIRRNTTVDILFKEDSNQRITGWQIYENRDLTNSFDSSKNTLIVDKDIQFEGLLIKLSRARGNTYRWLRFESTGYQSGGNNGRVSIQNFDLKTGKQLQIVFNRIGTVRTCTTKPGPFPDDSNNC